MPRVPHPVPYQGSKRRLAACIVECVPFAPKRIVEPFAGSAAVSLRAAAQWPGTPIALGDTLGPLIGIWRGVIEAPNALCAGYAEHWRQGCVHADHYERVRAAYNRAPDPASLLYLLARCVKAAVRFNQSGEFNQAPDRRRLGARPERMRDQVARAHGALAGRASAAVADFHELTRTAEPGDFVYLDPPYMGTSQGRDRRYARGLDRDVLIAALDELRARAVTFAISFDGRTDERRYGAPLPCELGLHHYEIPAGRSSQSTLLGGSAQTFESLYVTPDLRAPAGATRVG